jgi:high affinity Mn2+ porin
MRAFPGISLLGNYWGRNDDIVALAIAVNGISKQQQQYVNDGGMGLIVGDGQINYRPEEIIEAYYAVRVMDHVIFTPDYQFVLHPAYNSDRGPVNIFAVRLHYEF